MLVFFGFLFVFIFGFLVLVLSFLIWGFEVKWIFFEGDFWLYEVLVGFFLLIDFIIDFLEVLFVVWLGKDFKILRNREVVIVV